MYKNTQAKVNTPDGHTYLFTINARVQEDTLAPYLSVIVLDYTLRKAIGDQEDGVGLTVEG